MEICGPPKIIRIDFHLKTHKVSNIGYCSNQSLWFNLKVIDSISLEIQHNRLTLLDTDATTI